MTAAPPRLAADWLSDPGLEQVFRALEGQAVLVGGCVRNALMGLDAADVDLATPLPPDLVLERLGDARLRAIPTGIKHGTVTAVTETHSYEITTFRADVETDGRHATVRFSTDMAEDARRRDFTINALYARADGSVLDPIGGLPDLQARRVRFIGEAATRVREDYLRILRFFRFHAWYALGALDPEGLRACRKEAPGLTRLARERIGVELRKLLSAPRPLGAVEAMQDTGVLAHVLPRAQPGLLAALVTLEDRLGTASDWLARLVALCGSGPSPTDALRLSRTEAKRFERIAGLVAAPEPPALAAEAHGADIARAGLMISYAMAERMPPTALDAELARGASARFPLSADDFLRRGWQPGPELGHALFEARETWRQADFSLSGEQLLHAAADAKS
ncbi:MAG: CCA tRNA nucleotidyltransferase [Pseudomonadota bacterium]